MFFNIPSLTLDTGLSALSSQSSTLNSGRSAQFSRVTAAAFALVLYAIPAVAAPKESPAAPAATAAPVTAGDPFIREDYHLAARDQVQFQIFEEPDLLTLQRVSASGEIAVPMLGSVKVAGLTLREAEQNLNSQYVEKGFYVKPQVTLSLLAYAPRNVSVLGQVNKPDQIEFPVERETLGIVQAITLAGGFTRVAKTDSVHVIRSVNGKEEQYNVNVTGYLDSKTTEEFKLQPGDVVYVPERVF